MINFVDLETTSLEYLRGDILTWSCIITSDDLSIISKKTFKGRVERNSWWSHEAEKIHGISYQKCITWQPQAEMLQDIFDFYTQWPLMKWVDHSRRMFGHVSFDLGFAMMAFHRYLDHYMFYKFADSDNYESTWNLAAKHGIKAVDGNRRLDSLCERYGIDLKHHDSESDVMACYELYKIFNSERVFI